MDFGISRREFERALELLFGSSPIPIPEECNLSQRGVRLTDGLVKFNRFCCCISSFRKRLCRGQTNFSERVRLGETSIRKRVARVLRDCLFKIFASELSSIPGEVAQIESTLKIEFMRRRIIRVVFRESRAFIFSEFRGNRPGTLFRA